MIIVLIDRSINQSIVSFGVVPSLCGHFFSKSRFGTARAAGHYISGAEGTQRGLKQLEDVGFIFELLH
jgi:hypothetical protein